MESLRKNIKLIVAFALPIYLMVLANSMMNMHVHILSNGMVVKHAHPFEHSESDTEEHHHHTDDELSFYEGFTVDFYDDSTPLSGIDVYLPEFEKIGEVQSASYTNYHFDLKQLRAPPIS